MSFFSKSKLILPIKRKRLAWNIQGKAPQHFRLQAGSITVGRSNSNDLVISHDSVSRRHARFVFEGGQLFVEDLASTQGTWVGKQRINAYTRSPVPPNESVWLGQVEMRYESVEEVSIPYLWIGVSAGAILLPAVILVWLIYRPPASADLTCQSPPNYLITLPQAGPQPNAATAASPTPGGQIAATSAALETATPAAIQAVTYTEGAFLDLPFPYNGSNECGLGSDEQFQQASDRSWRNGRINSFFDHKYPIYTREGDESSYMVLFTGEKSSNDNYSGHAGFDFSTGAGQEYSTPVCAAADGWIVEAKFDPRYYGNYVFIKHVAQNNVYYTWYFHMVADALFENTQAHIGQPVHQYDRIGTMDNTGNSTGPHLHFEARLQVDSTGKTWPVDPYGYIPSAEYPEDPWTATVQNNYLWIHPYPNNVFSYTQTGNVKPEKPAGIGGEALPASRLLSYPHLCSPAKAVPSGGKLFFSLSLSPPPAQGLVSVARGLTFLLQDPTGNPIQHFDEPIWVLIPYTAADLNNISKGSLEIRRLNEEQNRWDYVDTVFDARNQMAGAHVYIPGQYALFGKPMEDKMPPSVLITADGSRNQDGIWCGAVTVTVTAKDDQSPVKRLQVKKRSESGWVDYSSTTSFTLEPEGKPDAIPDLPYGYGDDFPAGKGRFLVQARATDVKGNTNPQAIQMYIVIDPTLPNANCDKRSITVQR